MHRTDVVRHRCSFDIDLRNIHQCVVVYSESSLLLLEEIGEKGMVRVMYSGTEFNHRHRVSKLH